MAEEKKNNKKPVRQDWKPHWVLGLLQKVWMVLFSAFKIAAGAAATVLMICLVCGFVFAGVLGDYLQNDILPSAEMELPGSSDIEQTSYLHYVDYYGNIQRLQQVFTDIDREWASYDELPQDLINATVAIEDKRFYEHQGVDWITTIKACAKMFFGDDSVGGSSITQQLVKNVKEEKSVTVQRKVLEIFRAAQLEKKYDKDVIMEHYLSTIYLGNGCYGVKTAAATYFGKELELLTTAECASLISITNNPSIFDPYRGAFEEGGKTGKERNRERQEDVLWAMKDQGMLTEEEYNAALAQEMVFKAGIAKEDRLAQCRNTECNYKNTVSTLVASGDSYYCPNCNSEVPVESDSSNSVYSWFVDTCLEDVAKALAEEDGMDWNDSVAKQYKQKIQRGGYNIYTTLDMTVQNYVDRIYTDYDQIPSARGGQQLQSAIVVIDNRSGDIVAMSGGVGPKIIHDDWNRATDSQLQSGSSIKPLSIYAPAFENGTITPATVIKDLPQRYDGGAWPRNDDWTYRYKRSILQGVTRSINAVAANTLEKITTDYAYKFAKESFGLSTLVDNYIDYSGKHHTDNGFAPLAMGAQTWGVTVRDMASAFGTFANNGVYREGRTFTKVYDSEGNLILDNTQESREILSEKTVTYMNYCLVNAVNSGTGYEAKLNVTTAGKTGTTADNKDRWFCGFTGYYTAAVWTGYDNPAVVRVSGNPAAQLWKKVLAPLHSDRSDVALYDSSKLTSVSICLDSGKLATSACRNDIRTTGDFSRVTSAGVYTEDIPTASCDKHVEMDYCTVGEGVANEYCKHFAEVDPSVTIEKKALVKMTRSELDEIARAPSSQLQGSYYEDDWYVYMVDGEGNDAIFTGIYGDLYQKTPAPYITCSVHTKEAWESYVPPTPSEPEIPIEPSVPDANDPNNPGTGTQNPDAGIIIP